HLLATVLDRDLAPDTPVPQGWLRAVGKAAPRIEVPTSMSDGADPSFERWTGDADRQVDASVLQARQAVFPLHGLDPDDPRD
ncbi:MAG: acetoin utilization protein AcuC, partial [Thermocrispum sp.]